MADTVLVQTVPNDRHELLENLEHERKRQPLVGKPRAEGVQRDVLRQVLLNQVEVALLRRKTRVFVSEGWAM
jgi:hypothetical protein